MDFDGSHLRPKLSDAATLAAGHVLIHSDPIRFATKSGILVVSKRDDILELYFQRPS